MATVTRETPPFTPVTVVLETQEEVDELYSWAAHTAVSGEDENGVLSKLYEQLMPFKSKSQPLHWNALYDRIVKFRRVA